MIPGVGVVAIVLAGGLARRMGGGDKPLRRLGDRTLLDHVLDRVRPQVDAIALNANGDPGRFACWRLPVVADTVPGHPGPLAGILAGMRWAEATQPSGSLLLSVPGDTPFLPSDLVARLARTLTKTGLPVACAASDGERHPIVALWPWGLADRLQDAMRAGERRPRRWAETLGVAEAVFDGGDDDPFLNLNRPEDLAAAEARSGRS